MYVKQFANHHDKVIVKPSCEVLIAHPKDVNINTKLSVIRFEAKICCLIANHVS